MRLWCGTGVALRLINEQIMCIYLVVIASRISDLNVRMQIKLLKIFQFTEILIKFQTIVCLWYKQNFSSFQFKLKTILDTTLTCFNNCHAIQTALELWNYKY